MKTGVCSVTKQDHKTDNAANERRTVLRKRAADEAAQPTAGEGGGARRRFLPGTMRPKKTLDRYPIIAYERLC